MRNPFNRNKNNSDQTVAELENYYSGSYNSMEPRRSNTAKAWMMAILSLIITIAVIIALFFAVRWIYRTVTDDSSDNADTATSQTEERGEINVTEGGTVISGSNGADPRSEDDQVVGVLNPSDSDSDNDSNGNENGVVSDEAASTSRDTAGASNSASTSQLPDTGAGSDAIIAISFVVIVGYLASRAYQLR